MMWDDVYSSQPNYYNPLTTTGDYEDEIIDKEQQLFSIFEIFENVFENKEDCAFKFDKFFRKILEENIIEVSKEVVM